jgi:KDO2-lipid IV(A) lauroyltransferase
MLKWLEYIPFICIASLVRILPRTLALSFGKRLGQLGQHLQGRRVSISRDNLQKAFPEMSQEEVSKTISSMFKHLGMSFIDMLRVDKYSGQKDLDRYFETSGEENLEEALELGRGCIILTAHLGFWEAGSFFLPTLGYNTEVVAKPMRNPLVDAYFSRMRESNGNQIISSKKGARGILTSTSRGEGPSLLLFLADRRIQPPSSHRWRPGIRSRLLLPFLIASQTALINVILRRCWCLRVI